MRRHSFLSGSVAGLIVLLLFLIPAQRVLAQTTVTVDSADDDVLAGLLNDGECELREAIVAVNNNAATADCAFVGSGAPYIIDVDGNGLAFDINITPDRLPPLNRDNTILRGLNGLEAIQSVDPSNPHPNGLVIRAADVQVYGLIIRDFQAGLVVNDAPSAIIGVAQSVCPVNICRNVITNNIDGVIIQGINATGSTLHNNFIGLTESNAAAGNTRHGLILRQSAGNAQIGGDFAQGNTISGNGGTGVFLSGSGSNTFAGNRIGLDSNGFLPVPNAQQGIYMFDADNNTLTGNYIGGNSANGVQAFGTDNSTFNGNFIGLPRPPFSSGAGNTLTGLQLIGSSGNTVTANQIGDNGSAGISISSGSGNTLTGNQILNNGNLGVDLLPGGVTLNDPGDSDTGSNTLQNFPVLSGAATDGSTLEIAGTLNSQPNTTFGIEFFSSPACDASGYGEGETPLSTFSVTTDATGNASFVQSLAGTFTAGEVITALATSPGGSTSEFSQCVTIVDTTLIAAFTASPTTGNAPLTVNFTDTSTGLVTAYSWTFGDGGSSTLQNPQHIYNTPGTYTVTLTVSNSFGSDSATAEIVVSETPTATPVPDTPVPTETPPATATPTATFTVTATATTTSTATSTTTATATATVTTTATSTATTTSTATSTTTATATATVLPTNTATVTPRPTETPLPTPTLAPTIGVTKVSDGDDDVSIIIINDGGDANDVRIIEDLREDVRYLSSRAGSPVCVESGGRVNCQLNVIPQGGGATINLQLDTNGVDPASGRTTVIVDGEAVSTIDEPYIIKIGQPPVAGPGAEVTYTIRIINPTDLTAENLVVEDDMPESIEILDSNSTSGNLTISGQQVRLTQDTLAPGERITITLNTRVRDDELFDSISNEACLTSSSNPAPRCAEMSFLRIEALPGTGEPPLWAQGLRVFGGLAVLIIGAGGWLWYRRRDAVTR